MKSPILWYLAMVSSVFPVTVGLWKWKKLNKPLRYFIVFLIITVFQVSAEYYMGTMLHLSTKLLSDYFRSIELIFYLLFFRQFIVSARKNIIIFTFLVVYFFVWITISVYYYVPAKLNTPMALLSRIILSIVAMMTIYSQVHRSPIIGKSLLQQYSFYIATGILLYCAGTFLVLGLGNEIMKYGLEYFISMWYFNWSFFILANLLFSIAFLVSTNEST
jgi:hypothetical protein